MGKEVREYTNLTIVDLAELKQLCINMARDMNNWEWTKELRRM
ncbi:hypothetical protein [Bacillus sp. PK3_68]|nr:hypothetical protein [Bacillus sp. PK3_68]